jgi:glycosyltransferase involved in cell wall biosynthesis
VEVIVLSEERLERTPSGHVWGAAAYKFWARYLDVFDGVRIVARLRDVDRAGGTASLVTGPQVTVKPVPYYEGPLEYLKAARRVTAAVRNSFEVGDAVIMRLGCHIANPLYRRLRTIGAPYGVEVVGDPYEVYGPGVISHPLRPFFRWHFTRQQKRFCDGASSAAYVTERALQARYPCRSFSIGVSDVHLAQHGPQSVMSTHYSSVDLDEANFISRARTPWQAGDRVRLITVGSLEQMYKGTDVLIHAVAACLRAGIDLDLTIVGGGRYQAVFEATAERLGIAEVVVFTGALPGPDAVKARLNQADLFVLPSLTEGLPRALIEAMAWALPCVASAVGGIPELLMPEDLVAPGDAAVLAAKIIEVAGDPARLERMSLRNAVKAREFAGDVLRERRVAFYRHLRRQTEEWARGEQLQRVRPREVGVF